MAGEKVQLNIKEDLIIKIKATSNCLRGCENKQITCNIANI